jgi:hypothetical protein
MSAHVVTGFNDLDAYAAAAAIRARHLSPVELVERSVLRIEALDPRVNAFTVTFAEAAGQAAQAMERAITAGDAVGPSRASRSRLRITSGCEANSRRTGRARSRTFARPRTRFPSRGSRPPGPSSSARRTTRSSAIAGSPTTRCSAPPGTPGTSSAHRAAQAAARARRSPLG